MKKVIVFVYCEDENFEWIETKVCLEEEE